MIIENTTLNRWRSHAEHRGTISKCHFKTGLSRATIYNVLAVGKSSVGVYALMSKFFNKLDKISIIDEKS
jgi:hypothetical protein